MVLASLSARRSATAASSAKLFDRTHRGIRNSIIFLG